MNYRKGIHMKLNLSGTWQFALDEQKIGLQQEYYRRTTFEDTIDLPTTTAEAKKGEKRTERQIGHLTETYHFEGYAWFLKEIEIPKTTKKTKKRFFFSMERTRKSNVWVDGAYIGSFDSFYVEHRYELTQRFTPGIHTLVVMIDNTDYVSNGGHMTSPDTQTNWNGILGEISLEIVEDIAIEKLWIYPCRKNKKIELRLQLSQCNTLSEACVEVSCRLTRLRMKEGRDFEHFEPLYTQTADTRRAWIAENREQNVPYIIKTLAVLKRQVYNLPQCEEQCIDKLAQCEKQCSKIIHRLCSDVFSIEYPLGESAKEWDEYNPYVYELTVRILRKGKVLCERISHFGLRDLTHQERTLYCNDKEIFLRGTHDGMIFPLTGYAPMDLDSWLRVYGTSKEYGLNHYRYHTCCPPKAAFLAAAYLGMYVQAELAFWGSIYNKEDERCDKNQQNFLLEEGIRTLDAFGDLPSFFGMSMGNELWGSKEEINRIMGILKMHDTRHLYTQGSNNHQFAPSVLSNDDFFSGVRFSKYRLFRGSYAMCDAPLGFVQTQRPGAYWNYDDVILPAQTKRDEVVKSKTIQIQYGTGIKEVETTEGGEEMIAHVPVISHEIGQYEFTPDFQEIALYTGVLQPENLKIFRERMEEKGLFCYADDYLYASGKLAEVCYKLELEAAFRSAELSGFQLLDIKDFSGQGTALVGILNAFHKNKGVVARDKWRKFCSDAVLLPTLDGFVMQSDSCVDCEVKLRYYRPERLLKPQLKVIWYLKQQAGSAVENRIEKQIQIMECPEIMGRGLFSLGTISLKVPACNNNAMYELHFVLSEENVDAIENEYDIFVYEESAIQKETVLYDTKLIKEETISEKAVVVEEFHLNDRNVCITNHNKAALEACHRGEFVLLFVKPNSTLPDSTIKGEYCTDFWCYPMFRSISERAGKPVPVGTMGLLIDNTHPALSGFASETYTTAQWYPIVSHSRPMILDKTEETKYIKPIVRMMDNFERNHNLGLIYELRHSAGKMLVCHVDLLSLKKEFPEADCLYRSLVDYVKSAAFQG